ncbi:MAG: anaerobic ribonucleoside-triphosphate reductase [Oscillospiraceae bacterium]
MAKTIVKEEIIGEGVTFERIRRITGYLVGTLDRFNDAKFAEVNDRVKHSMGTGLGEMEQV